MCTKLLNNAGLPGKKKKKAQFCQVYSNETCKGKWGFD